VSYPAPPDELVSFVSSYQTYFLIGHVEPDGDCLASALALGTFLKRQGKDVRLLNEGPFFRPEIKRIEHHFETSIDPKDLREAAEPAVVILDCSTPERVGSFRDAIPPYPTAVIDHHASGAPYGDVSYVVREAPATSLLVQNLIEAAAGKPTEEEARYILFALATDTGYFRHLDIGSGPAFRAVGRLVDAGASPKDAHLEMYGGKSIESRRLLGVVLARSEFLANGRAALAYETLKETEKYGRSNRDSETLYQLLMGTGDCTIICLIREESPGSCTGSLRSRDDTDVATAAGKFGGGGHRRAAGFLVEKPLDEVLPEMRLLLEELAGV
jgi:bifunctional oligoribonuclease and PAP phosphatase NrnA